MKIDSKREWESFALHVVECKDCVRCEDTSDEKQASLLCGEGAELLAVARMHTREELEQSAG